MNDCTDCSVGCRLAPVCIGSGLLSKVKPLRLFAAVRCDFADLAALDGLLEVTACFNISAAMNSAFKDTHFLYVVPVGIGLPSIFNPLHAISYGLISFPDE